MRPSHAFPTRQWLPAVLLFCAMAPAQAQDGYPNRPIRVVVPYPPGGNTDIVTRDVMKELAQRLRQPIVVENKPGANSIIGTDFVAKSPPDGYTLGVVIGGYAINQALHKKLPYGPRDLVPVSLMTRTGLVLAATPSVPRSFKDFVALGRKGERSLGFATSGTGGANHLLGERFVQATGMREVVAVPYKGSADARSDLLSGRVHFTFDATSVMAQYFKAETLNALAVTSHARSPLAPEVPTIGELGYPELVTYAWAGLVAPAGTPPAVVEKLAREIAAVLREPALREKLEAGGSEAIGSTPAQFQAFVDEETRVARDIGQRLSLSLE